MSDNNNNKISLENCDFNKKKARITSPYSLMACELIGVDQDDLFLLSKEEYIRNNLECQNISKELQEERYNHYNLRRRKLIDNAKKKREKLIAESNNNKYGTNYNVNNSKNIFNCYSTQNKTFYDKNMKKSSSVGTFEQIGDGGGSTAIKNEREKLKKLKERQEINIKLIIDYECTLEENRRKNIEKMRAKEKKEEIRKYEKYKEFCRKMKKEEEKEREKKKREEEYKHKMEEKRKKEEEKEKKKKLDKQKKQEKEEKEKKIQL
jgi:hypothetical protein